MQGNESPGKITVPNVLCQEHTVFCLLLLSYPVLIHHLGRAFRKTEQPTETLCSYHLLRILYGYVHTHKYTHTLTSALKPKGKNSSTDAIHFY